MGQLRRSWNEQKHGVVPDKRPSILRPRETWTVMQGLSGGSLHCRRQLTETPPPDLDSIFGVWVGKLGFWLTFDRERKQHQSRLAKYKPPTTRTSSDYPMSWGLSTAVLLMKLWPTHKIALFSPFSSKSSRFEASILLNFYNWSISF